MKPTIVFAGDSVTDCGRREDPQGLGDGYVRLLSRSAALSGWRVVNRGVSGDRVADLRRRWETDVLAESPELISILIGVNNTWRRFDSNDPTTAADFERDYRAILESAAREAAWLVVVEPFVLPVLPGQEQWRGDLSEKIEVTRSLARDFRAILVSADKALNLASTPADFAPDGVHPSARGHEALAMAWLAATAGVLI